MPQTITPDDILGGAPGQTDSGRAITAQDILDVVPRDPAPQAQLVDQSGQDVNPLSLDYANSPQDIPNGLNLQQRPTGADQNVMPGGTGFGANLKAGFVEDPATKIRMHAKAMFPNDPNAAQRFGVRDGKVMYIDDQGNIRDAESGFGSRAGSALAYTPETVGAIVGSFATGNPVAGSAIGAAGGKGVKQIIAGTLLDEPQTMGGNAAGMATEAGVALGAGLIGKGASKFFNKGRVVDFTPEQLAESQALAQEIEKRLGIKIDISQASQDPVLMALRKYASKFPGQSSKIIKELDETQTGQTANAMQGLMDRVATATASESAGSRGINAAERAIRDARREVSNEVRPLYEAAYAAVPEVTRVTAPGRAILDFLQLPYFKEAFSAGQTLRRLESNPNARPKVRTTETLDRSNPQQGTLDRATTVVESTDTNAQKITSRLSTGERQNTADGVLTTRTDTTHTDITRPSLAELDYTKRALDERIESMIGAGQRQRARAVQMKRDQFVAALDALPNQQWQAARRRYGELAQQRIEPLESGAIGVLARTENRKAATVAAKMFGDHNITANEIKFARGAIEKADPEAWNQLTRQYLASTLNKSLRVTQKGETANLAGKLFQGMAGTPEQLAKLRAAMPKEAQPHLDDVLGAFKLIAATERIGSDTAFNQLVTKKIEGRFSTTLKMLRQPVQTMIQTGEEKSLERMVLKLSEGLTDPAKIAQLKQVSKASPGLNRALQIASILGVAPAERVAEGEINPLPDTPIRRPEPRRGASTRPPMRESP